MLPPLKAHPEDVRTLWSRRWRLEHLYKIRTEDRGLRKLRMDDRPIQNDLFKKAEDRRFRGIRIINLKGRKQGVTTFWGLFYLDDTIFTPNTTSCIIAHKEKDLRKIFRTIKTAYTHMPEGFELANGRTWYKPQANLDNVNELVFNSINSQIYVALDSRGDTNNNLHITEGAHIPNAEERMAGTLESVPGRDLGSNITIESTAYGVGGWFHDMWYSAEKGENGYDPVFFPWFLKPTNRLTPPSDFFPTEIENELIAKVAERYGIVLAPEQVYWWRMTKASQKKLMNQEHPTFPDDAFLSSAMMVFEEQVIKDIRVKEPIRTTARGWKIYKEPQPGHWYVVAGDPADGTGGDYSAGEVYDGITLEQVAEFYDNTVKQTVFGEYVLPEAARMYNNAILVIESNKGETTIDRAKRVYGRLFMRTTFDERTDRKTNKIGWETNSHTRDLMLDDLEEVVNDGTVTINSAILKSEMLTFVTNPDGKREAKAGYNDDAVMASAIAVKVATMPRSSYGVYEIN